MARFVEVNDKKTLNRTASYSYRIDDLELVSKIVHALKWLLGLSDCDAIQTSTNPSTNKHTGDSFRQCETDQKRIELITD
jgi:hypothetical protein